MRTEKGKIIKKLLISFILIMGFIFALSLYNNQTLAATKFPGGKGKEKENMKKDVSVNQQYIFDTQTLWENPYIFCVQPQYLLHNNSNGTIEKEYYINSKTGVRKNVNSKDDLLMATIYAAINENPENLSGEESYGEYLKKSAWQHIIWIAKYGERNKIGEYVPKNSDKLEKMKIKGELYYVTNTVSEVLPWTNIVRNGVDRAAWHYYDPITREDEGLQSGLELKVKLGYEIILNMGYVNEDIYTNKNIRIEDNSAKVTYDSSKTELSSYKEYIIVGPFEIKDTRKSDEIKNISIEYKKNGKTVKKSELSTNNDIKFVFQNYIFDDNLNITGKEWKDGYPASMTDTTGKFYIVINKNAGITSIDNVNIKFKRRQIEAKWWDIRIDAGQNLVYGWGKFTEENIDVKVDVPNLIPPVQVELDKVDTAGAAVSGAKFSIEYSNGLKGETKTVGTDGKIKFSQVQPTSPDSFTATIKETSTPSGYKMLEKPIELKFTYDSNNAVWKVEKTSGPDEKVTIGTVTKDNKSGTVKIPIKVENKSIIEKLTLLKTSSVSGGKVEGAKFKLTLTNVASIKNHQIPEAGEVTIIETTNSDGNLVLEDIEIKNLNEPVVITIEEIEAPVGYKKIEGIIKLTIKRTGTTYTITKEIISSKNNINDNGSVIKGDVNGDGKLDQTDAELVLKYAIGTIGESELNTKNADMDNDGKITTKDAQIILAIVEGKQNGGETTKGQGNIEEEVNVKEEKPHEIKVEMENIPIMNLGGIVWTEEIQTGKEQPEINNQYDGENQDEALGGVEVRLLDENNNVIATTTTAKQDGEKVTYLNNLGKEVTVELKQGQYLFTKLDNGTNYIPVRTDYKVEIDYDGITYNALMNTDANILYNKNAYSKITSEDDHGLADGTKTISGTENNKEQSTTNGDYTINYTLQDEEKIPDKAIYSNVEKDGKQVFVTARSEKYLQKTEDWESIWKDNNGVGEIDLDSYVFDINFGLYKKLFDLNLGTDVDSAEIKINGQTTTYNYDQILDGMLDKELREKLYRTTDDKVDYNLYLAHSDYDYRIDDYKVPGNEKSLGKAYGDTLSNGKAKDTELQVYVTYTLQINNQSTQHKATGVKVKYSYDGGYEYVGDVNVDKDENNVLEISGIDVEPGESKEIALKFKVKKNEDGTFVKAPSEASKYTNMAEIIEYSTEEGRLVDADSAPGNTFLGENNPTDRREDDTDTANGIVINFKNEERSISGKVFEDSNKNSTQNDGEQGVNNVIVQLIELVEINKQQYEYIWQETVAGSDTVKTTATSGGRGETYNVSNSDGEYKFTQRIIPGNYIVRFIYGDGRTYTTTGNTLTYNGEDYKSTYVDYNYNAEWYNDTKIGEDYLYKINNISKAVDNEARRLRVMSYAVDVDGTKGKKLDLLDADIAKLSDDEMKTLKEEVIPSTWMCAETLKIKMPVDTDIKDNTSDTTEVGNGSSPTISNTQFDNVNLGLMERPKTKLVLEKHITGLTVRPVASGVSLIANATADINDILKATQGSEIELKGQKDGLFATKSERTNRGLWYLQTDTTELAQGADAFITYTYVIKNEGEKDYLNEDLIAIYRNDINAYANELSRLEEKVKKAKKRVTGTAYTNGTYISNFYYTGDASGKDTEVLASVEQIQEALNPKVKFVNSTTDFTKAEGSKTYNYYDIESNLKGVDIKEIITSTQGTKKLLQPEKTLEAATKDEDKNKIINDTMDTSKKLVVSVGLSASEIENGGVYDSYIAQVTRYTNAAGRRDQSTPDNLSYVHSENTNITLDSNNPNTNKKYNEEDEFWAERFTITKPTGEDKITPVQIAIITISAVAVLGVGIILIKKFVLKK